jgi:hypothetical protein
VAAPADSTEQDEAAVAREALPAVSVARPVDLLIATATNAGEKRTPPQVEVRLPPRRGTQARLVPPQR